MPLDAWSARNELLNEFLSVLNYRTHGRLSHLSLDVVDGALFIEAISTSYYNVQLALAAIQAFWADIPTPSPAKMSFVVDGHPLVLLYPDMHGFGLHEMAGQLGSGGASCESGSLIGQGAR